MKKIFYWCLISVMLTSLFACASPQKKAKKQQNYPSQQHRSGDDYSFVSDGRDHSAPYLYQTYTRDRMPNVETIRQCDLRTAIDRQRNYLYKKSASQTKYLDGVTISVSDQLYVLDRIDAWLSNPRSPFPNLNAYKIAGKDNLGNVQFTGYYSPKMLVSSYPTSRFRYPVYAPPSRKSNLPSRDAIDFQGALSGQGLEIGYAESLIDLFFMQIQGSGIVEFVDTGEVATFAYAGKNGHRYYSIGRYLVEQGYMTPGNVSAESIKQWLRDNPGQMRYVMSLNPSYVFFKKTQRLPTGASGQPVTAYCSVAVDPRIIPYGSTMIIKRPVLDARGELVSHQNSLFFAQDRGGAIKGSGRIDIYTGVGAKAEQEASALKHYGSLWLLTP